RTSRPRRGARTFPRLPRRLRGRLDHAPDRHRAPLDRDAPRAVTTLHDRLRELATHGATDAGIDRALFTAAERAARERFAAWSAAAGFHVEQDRAGNVFARL